jgi:hypothetical protein
MIDEDKRKVAVVEIWIGGVGVILYLVLLITLGVITIRKGHWVMFITAPTLMTPFGVSKTSGSQR